MEQFLIETLVESAYRKHGLDPREPASPWDLASFVLGGDAIDSFAGTGSAYCYQLADRWRIVVDPTLAPEDAAFALSHELAHVMFALRGFAFESHEEEEESADRLGAALLAPRPAMFVLRRALGLDLDRIAQVVVCTPTWAALRVGEVTQTKCIVESPATVRVRGPGWKTTEPMAALAMARASTRGVRKPLRGGRTAYFPDFLAA